MVVNRVNGSIAEETLVHMQEPRTSSRPHPRSNTLERLEEGLRRATAWRGVLRRRASCLIGLGAVAVLAAACSSGGSSTPSTAAPASTSPSTARTSSVVKVVTVPTYGQILTDSSGKPLYTLSGSCTGACASAWPALSVPAGTKPSGGAGVTGTLSAVKQADGTYQVTYNGSPVYTFVQDSSGQVTGQGVAGFSVVKVSGSGSATPTGSTTSTTSGSGY